MKTPDEIKKGLECCIVGECSKCPYMQECDDHLDKGGDMVPADVVLADVLSLIQQLERERDQYKRERDAALADLAENRRCETCKYYTPGYFCIGCRNGDQWEWRGVQEVER